VVGAEHEPVVARQLLGEGAEHVIGHLAHPPAHLAHEVLVAGVGQVELGPPVAEVHVLDDTLALECLQGSIDGRAVNLGPAALHPCRELVGRDVVAAVDEGLGDRPAGRGEPPAVPAECSEQQRKAAIVASHGVARRLAAARVAGGGREHPPKVRCC